MAADDGCGSSSYGKRAWKFKLVLHGAYHFLCLICVILQKVQNFTFEAASKVPKDCLVPICLLSTSGLVLMEHILLSANKHACIHKRHHMSGTTLLGYHA